MTDLKRTIQDDKGVKRPDDEAPRQDEDRARTAGKGRDYDESGASKNQAHGHPREERGRSEDRGDSDRVVREKVSGADKVGGKVRRKTGEGAGRNVRD